MLYIRPTLTKSGSAKLEKAKNEKAKHEGGGSKTGEQRGGNYVSRVQEGYEKDGSPRYKYFQSLEERDKYLAKRGQTGTESKRALKRKLKREQTASKEKTQSSHGKVASGKLFVRQKKEKEDEEKTEKSLSVFIWRLE